jgi:hypothetical protein
MQLRPTPGDLLLQKSKLMTSVLSTCCVARSAVGRERPLTSGARPIGATREISNTVVLTELFKRKPSTEASFRVASALLGPGKAVFGTSILGANYAADGGGESATTSASSTFDFGYGGDLELGLIGNQENGFAGGAGFQSMEFTIEANGVEILDTTFRSLSIAESFFRDQVIDLGSNFGSDIDLTFGYTLVADGPGGFGFDFALGGAVPQAVPEPSTWAMMLVGFAGLGFAGHRSARRAGRRETVSCG